MAANRTSTIVAFVATASGQVKAFVALFAVISGITSRTSSVIAFIAATF
jgi:hypothetical protein